MIKVAQRMGQECGEEVGFSGRLPGRSSHGRWAHKGVRSGGLERFFLLSCRPRDEVRAGPGEMVGSGAGCGLPRPEAP